MTMESSGKPWLRALAGEPVWPPPIWLMRQAGRYLPEYRAVRARAGDFISLCMTPELATEVTLQPIRRYRFDGAILFSDILLIPLALGQGLEYHEGEGPVLPPLRSAADIGALHPERVGSAISPVLETVRRVRHSLADEGYPLCSLIGFAGAPFTVACYMVEGGGSRDFAVTRTMAYADPALFGELVQLLTEATVTYLSAQIEAGAEAVMLFDTWAGILSSAHFRQHVIEPAQTIVTRLRQLHPRVPIIGFPRLAGMLVAEFVRGTGIDGVGLDSSMDLRIAARAVPERIAIQGNLDPFALVAGGLALREQTAEIMQAMRTRPFVFNLGHGIVPQTPPEHVASLVEQVRAAQ
jgi:uroporphyrinogen decarboxylase